MISERVGLVPRVNQFPPRLILGRMVLRVGDHALDVGLRKTSRSADRDLLLLASRQVLRLDVDDAVGVDVE